MYWKWKRQAKNNYHKQALKAKTIFYANKESFKKYIYEIKVSSRPWDRIFYFIEQRIIKQWTSIKQSAPV